MNTKKYESGRRGRAGHDRRREQKRSQVLSAAFELFRLHGFDNVSVREIASQAGVSPVTVFTYFSDKQNLIRETIRDFLDNHAREISDILAGPGTVQDRLAGVFAAKLALAAEFQGGLLIGIQETDPEFKEEILSRRSIALRVALQPLLEEGRRSGAVASDVTDDDAIAFLDVVGAGMSTSPGFTMYLKSNPDGMRRVTEVAFRALSAARSG